MDLERVTWLLHGLLAVISVGTVLALYYFVKGFDELKQIWHEIEHPGDDKPEEG